jgi:hypothetical protein
MNNPIVKDFIKFVVKELGLKSLPKQIKFVDSGYAEENLSFGGYNPLEETIVICKGDRHLADVLRTLAHELVHHKQKETGVTLDNSDDSPTEQEANAVAGIIMRKFKTIRPEIFLTNPSNTDKIKTILTVVKTGKPQKIDEQYVDVFTAKLLATVLHKLTPTNKQKFISESIDRMVAVAYKMITQ